MKRLSIIKDICITATAVGLLMGCSYDETISENLQSDLPIMFSSAEVGTELLTRTDASDTYNSALPANSNIGVYIYDSDGIDISVPQSTPSTSTTWVYKTVGAADATTHKSTLQLISHTRNPRYPTISGTSTYKDHVKIFAVFPNNTDVTPSTASYTFSVAADQRVPENIIASDLMTSDIAQYTATQCEEVLDLELRHRMAKLHVTLTPKSGSDLTADNIPTNFDVLNVYRTLTITLATGTISSGNADITTTSAPMLCSTEQSFFIPPQTISASTDLLRFNLLPSGEFLGINGVTFRPASNVTFEAGKVYNINVTVDVDFATMTGTITEWTNEDLPYDPRVL